MAKINIWRAAPGRWRWEILDGEPHLHAPGRRASVVAQGIYRDHLASGTAPSHAEALARADLAQHNLIT